MLANNLQKNVYNLGFAGVTSQEIALLAGVDKYTLVTTNEDDVTIGKELGAEITISVALKKMVMLCLKIHSKHLMVVMIKRN